MSIEEFSSHPLSDTDSVKNKVIELHKNHSFLQPDEEEIIFVFENGLLESAKAIYDRYSCDDENQIAKGQINVNPNSPGFGNTVRSCKSACARGNCSSDCKEAIRVHEQIKAGRPAAQAVQPQGALEQAKRILSPKSRLLNRGSKNARLQAMLDGVQEEIDSEIRRNPDTKAFLINKKMRETMVDEIYGESQRMKEMILNQKTLSPFSYTKDARDARQKLFGGGAAASDVFTAALKSKHVDSVLGNVNDILNTVEERGGIDSYTKEKIADFMKSTNSHIFGFSDKVDKLMENDAFVNGYIQKMQEIGDIYNKMAFREAYRDGNVKSEVMIQEALKDIPPGSTEAAKIALNELGEKKHGDAFDTIFKNGVDGFIKKNAEKLVKEYGNKASPEERNGLILDITQKSPYLQSKIKELESKNKFAQEYKLKARYNVQDFNSLPNDVKRDIAKGTIKDLYHVDGDKGIVNAAKYFGGIVDDDLINEAKGEYVKEQSGRIMNDWSDYTKFKETAPILADLKTNPDKFSSSDYDTQKDMRKQLEKELDAIADTTKVDKNSDAYKAAKKRMLNEFTPMSDVQRDRIKKMRDNFSKPITRSDGVRMYTADLYKQPLEFLKNNKDVANKLMFDESGNPTKFGEYMNGVMNGIQGDYAHPIFGKKEVATASGIGYEDKSEEEIINDLKGVVESVPPQYREQVFNDRIRNYANTPVGKPVSRNVSDYASDGGYVQTAEKYGINPADQKSFDKISAMVDKHAAFSNKSPKTPTDVINAANSLENKFKTDRNMTEDEIDNLATDIANARGKDYVNKLLQERYDSLRDVEADEGAVSGLYKHTDPPAKREAAYDDFLTKNGQFSNMVTPDKPRNYSEWRKYQLATGGRDALRDIKLMQMTGDRNAIYDSLEKRLSDMMYEASAELGEPVSLNNIHKISDPSKIQAAREYVKAIEDLAMGDNSRQIGNRYSQFLNNSYDYNNPVVDEANNDFLMSSPDQWSKFFGATPDGALVLNTPEVRGDAQFRDLYNGVKSMAGGLASKKRNGTEEGKFKAANYLLDAVEESRGKSWDDARNDIADSILNRLSQDVKIDDQLKSGEEASYEDLSKKNPIVANALSMVKAINPKKYHDFATTIHESPKDVYNKALSGELLNPTANEKYKSLKNRSMMREKLMDSLTDDALLEKYTGVNRNSPGFQEMRNNIHSALRGAESGQEIGKMFAGNPENPENMNRFANEVSSTIGSMNLPDGSKVKLDDESLNKIPDLESRYKLKEIKNVLDEYGTDADKAVLNKLSIGNDGKLYLDDGNPNGFAPDNISDVLSARRNVQRADSRIKKLQNGLSKHTFTDADKQTLMSDKIARVGNKNINSAFSNKLTHSYSDLDVNSRLSELNGAIANLEKSGIPDGQKSMLLGALNANAKLYSEMSEHMASGDSPKNYIEKKAGEIMSGLSAERGVESMDINQLIDAGKLYMNRGKMDKAFQFYTAASQMKDLFDLFDNYASYADWNTRDFMNSSWDIDGNRKERGMNE
jgi:hypothetical protein